MQCSSCGKVTKYYCCFQNAYCNETCQSQKWTQHKQKCTALGKSQVLGDEGLVGEKHDFFLNREHVALLAEFRIVPGKTQEELVLEKPGLSKMMKDYGIKYLPKLEVFYGFRKGYDFLRKLDFALKIWENDERQEEWVFPEVTITSDYIALAITLNCLLGNISYSLESSLYDIIISIRKGDVSKLVYPSYQPGANKDTEKKSRYQNSLSLYARLLYENNYALFQPLLTRDQYSLEIISLQGYLMSKLKKLHEKRQVDSFIASRNESGQSFLISVPDFDSVWNLIVDGYEKLHINTYYVSQLKRKDCLSVVVKSWEGYEIFGYVTCTLHFKRKPQDLGLSISSRPFVNEDIAYFASVKFSPKIFSHLSIDGLHVMESIRGGRENSLATLLIFHILFFLRESVITSLELGDVLVCSNAVARSTMLILKQFGFHFLYPRKQLKWLGSDPKKTNLMTEVVAYIDQYKSIDIRLEELLQNKQGDTNEEAMKMITILNKYYSRDKYESDDSLLGNGYLKQWNTFMILSAKKENVVFEKEMARITDMIQGSDRKIANKTEKRISKIELDSEREEKKAKFSVSISYQLLEFI